MRHERPGRGEDPIASGLELYEELVAAEPELERELERSQAHFDAPGTGPPAERLLAQRRHVEWFLFERPSDHLGGVPAVELRDSWAEAASERGVEDLVLFAESFAGVFEVTSCEAGRGLWATDLFGSGEYPLLEPAAALGIETGDLLVGRVFPFRDGSYRLSPAACSFRDARLLQAVRADLQRMRAARRGVLRIEQVELERLFFGAGGPGGGDTTSAPPPDVAAERRRAEAALREAGLSADESGATLARVREAARLGAGDAVLEILNRLAFETEADLECARRTLGELWTLERDALDGPEPPASDPDEARSDDAPASGDAVRSALDSFDRGRRSGADLEQLFDQLAQDLGFEAEGEVDTGELPDFPGVVGAMVEEFLWDTERERGVEAARAVGCLRRLAEYAAEIGVFEDLSRRHVVDFAARWLLDSEPAPDEGEAAAVVRALDAFCRWCQDQHAHALHEACAGVLEQLADAVPRHSRARRWIAGPVGDEEPWDVVAVDGAELVLRGPRDEERAERLDRAFTSQLRPGDLLHARFQNGELRIGRTYPAVLRELLERRRARS